jgi:hypothetical protein
MRQKKHWFVMIEILTVLAVMLPNGAWAESTYKVLHRFKGPDGGFPVAGGPLKPCFGLSRDVLSCRLGHRASIFRIAVACTEHLVPPLRSGWQLAVGTDLAAQRKCRDPSLASLRFAKACTSSG